PLNLKPFVLRLAQDERNLPPFVVSGPQGQSNHERKPFAMFLPSALRQAQGERNLKPFVLSARSELVEERAVEGWTGIVRTVHASTRSLRVRLSTNEGACASLWPRTLLPILFSALVLSGCATMPDWLSSSGASREQVQERDTARIEGIELIDVNDALARKIAAAKKLGQLADIFPSSATNHYLIGPGDVIEVSVWEAPPAMLFGAVVLDPDSGPTTTRVVTLPEQMVTPDGTITMPFAGRVRVQG